MPKDTIATKTRGRPAGKAENGGRKKKDPNAPKRSVSAYIWYCSEERPKVKEEMPESSMGNTSKELGRRWKLISEEGKKKYQAMADKDRARYEKEIEIYRASNGKAKEKASAKAKKAAALPMEEQYEDSD